MKNASYLTLGVIVTATSLTGIAAVIQQDSRDPYRPLQTLSSAPPLNMLVLGRDHKLWYEAYNDASDLDGDGYVDVGYKGWMLKPGQTVAQRGNFKIDYYGYFDSYKCYRYANNQFEPVATTSNKKCSTVSGGRWSGDFLNYLTMSRIDAIRKVLYGGTRSTDSTTATILERAYIPQDAHSWGKEYFTESADGYKISDYTPLAQPNSGRRHLFANTTVYDSTYGGYGNPPLLRYTTNQSVRIWDWVSREGPVAGTSLGSTSISPVPVDMTVRVKVCDSSIGLESNCKRYGSIYKPTGLLQQYGDSDNMRFGLLTGSYSNNLRGGILRKEIGKFNTEINSETGQFTNVDGIVKSLNALRIVGFGKYSTPWGSSEYIYKCSWNFASTPLTNGNCEPWGNPVGEMLYETMRYFSGASTATSTFSSDAVGDTLGLPRVTSWKDPYGSTSGNNVCSKPFATLIADINPSWDGDNLSSPSLNGKSINLASIGSDLWNEEFKGAADVVVGNVCSPDNQAACPTANKDAPTRKSVNSFWNITGLAEEPGKKGSFSSPIIANFARTNDINPAAGTQAVSTFSVALASPLPKIEVPIPNSEKRVTIIPFAKSVNGSGITPTGAYQPVNQIVDFYVDTILNMPGFPYDQAGQSVTGRIAGKPYYKFRINFEDVEYGGDHDMDAIAEYEVTLDATNKVKVDVKSRYASGGIIQHMGYVLSGTGSSDGIYLVVRDCDTANPSLGTGNPCQHTGTDPAADVDFWMDTPNTTNQALPLADSRTFTPVDMAATKDLKSPLWYVAKYGGFIDNDADNSVNLNKLDDSAEWDADGDGTPDNYFLVVNPLKLEEQLGKAFAKIDATARATAQIGASGGSTSTEAEDLILYRASYVVDKWSGEISAFNNNTNDTGLGSLVWSSKDNLIQPGVRKILTHNNSTGTGLAFRSSSVATATAQWANLNTSATGTVDSLAADRLDYLRGSSAKEGTASSDFRVRQRIGGQSNYYGDILDTAPYYVNQPIPGYRTDAGYKTHVQNIIGRGITLYAGANDGMLHAMNAAKNDTADRGKERFAYVPGIVYPKLSKLMSSSYQHEYYVNGQITVNDVEISTGNYKTALVSTLGFGGKGLFALDVTRPEEVTEASASNVLWEFSSTDDADMGYQLSSAIMVQANDNKWYAITGNGVNSNNGHAVLFLLEMSGPSKSPKNWTGKYLKFDTNVGSPTDKNGMSAVNFVSLESAWHCDGSGDQKVDLLYAGDLFGNVWKFDMRSAKPAEWKFALTNSSGQPKPIFTATGPNDKRQAIANFPGVGVHPEAGCIAAGTVEDGTTPKDDIYVFFGTGKFMGDCDKNNTCTDEDSANTIYGLRDQGNAISKSELLKRTYGYMTQSDVDSYNSGKDGKDQVALNDVSGFVTMKADPNCKDKNGAAKICEMDWKKYQGWYMNMVDRNNVIGQGTRAVGSPRRIGKTLMVFNVMNLDQATDQCTINGSMTTLVLDYGTATGQSRSRFTIVNNSGKTVNLPNIGYTTQVFQPNGSVTLGRGSGTGEGGNVDTGGGIGDSHDGGRCYGGICNSGGKKDCTTEKCTKINVSRTVTPVNWREVIQ
ncbi:pilus assembly protein [Chitinolyticbacter meiyuanensis]|uniref:pilus assembly protein n=1 Tax=Chitinolyticbacter meiyuanensis TaxID=682798 RepID=UPI0011E604CE|nr:PilC/PilY family type IV pilus protein [Chitinolyticbacter meiyuanensis]